MRAPSTCGGRCSLRIRSLLSSRIDGCWLIFGNRLSRKRGRVPALLPSRARSQLIVELVRPASLTQHPDHEIEAAVPKVSKDRRRLCHLAAGVRRRFCADLFYFCSGIFLDSGPVQACDLSNCSRVVSSSFCSTESRWPSSGRTLSFLGANDTFGVRSLHRSARDTALSFARPHLVPSGEETASLRSEPLRPWRIASAQDLCAARSRVLRLPG